MANAYRTHRSVCYRGHGTALDVQSTSLYPAFVDSVVDRTMIAFWYLLKSFVICVDVDCFVLMTSCGRVLSRLPVFGYLLRRTLGTAVTIHRHVPGRENVPRPPENHQTSQRSVVEIGKALQGAGLDVIILGEHTQAGIAIRESGDASDLWLPILIKSSCNVQQKGTWTFNLRCLSARKRLAMPLVCHTHAGFTWLYTALMRIRTTLTVT